MLAQEDGAFGLLWQKMTDEVFHLLFGNRAFLLKFVRFRGACVTPGSPPC
jgi:hypothetical protein